VFSLSLLLPFDTLKLDAVQTAEPGLTIMVASTVKDAACPDCQTLSSRVHSRYTRTVADLPWAGFSLVLRLLTRRFFCDLSGCSRKTFAEPFGPALPSYARRTLRLTNRLRAIAFATTGQGGARLAHEMAMPISPSTLLRLMHASPPTPRPEPQAVGLDDWAWKKGRTYGTICVDLDRHQPIDLLPERSPELVAAWLKTHPEIEVITRDRGHPYIEGATRGAPQALQVADRWHLLQNLGEALTTYFGHHQELLKRVADELATAGTDPTRGMNPVPTLDGITKNPRSEAAGQRWHARAVETYERIQALRAQEMDVTTIAREVGVSRQTVYRSLNRSTPPPRMHGQGSHAHVLEPFKQHVVQRWNEGCRNARQIWRELQAQGYEHSSRPVAWFMAELRKETGSGRGWATVEAAAVYDVESKRKRPLTARQAAHLIVMRAEKRSAWEETYHRHLCEADPKIGRVVALASDFTEMVRQRQGTRLEHWLVQAETSKVAELCSFAASLRKDYRAVKAGLSLLYSNGQTEGQITRLKLLKRMSYGRAGLELLRHRVLYREPPLPVHSRKSKVGAQLAA
jgi:transposase